MMADNEDSLAVRAAWLHYVGGFTQAAVAKRLGIPSVKAHRLIARAVAEGVVNVSIDGDIAECASLEVELSTRYGLDYCEVSPDIDDDPLALTTLGHAGASFLRREIEHAAPPSSALATAARCQPPSITCRGSTPAPRASFRCSAA